MKSDGNILRLLSSFFLLDRPFLVHPSIILRLILKIKIMNFLDVSAASQIAEAELFFGAL